MTLDTADLDGQLLGGWMISDPAVCPLLVITPSMRVVGMCPLQAPNLSIHNQAPCTAADWAGELYSFWLRRAALTHT